MTDAAHRCGVVSIVGRPNVGKSTLLNRMVGEKVSITSRKPQTTRQRITGIRTTPEAQLVFVDTPGFQTEHRTTLNRIMNRTVRQALEDVDAIVWVIEAMKFDQRDKALLQLLPAERPVVLAMNKVDHVRDKRALLPFIEEISRIREFAAVVPVSAARGDNVDALVGELVRHVPEAPRMYDDDEITTLPERFLAAELVRE